MPKTNLTKTNLVSEFLSESNKIENVFDEGSLKDALKAWNYLIKQPELTVSVILKTHRILMKNQSIEDKYKGAFRDCRVWVGDREGLEYQLVPLAIGSWVKKANKSKTWGSIKENHIRFETVHPWLDGNGRTGRMFMNWERLRVGLPILIIHSDWPKKDGEQVNYYKWFQV